jgi:hypothetical protein
MSRRSISLLLSSTLLLAMSGCRFDTTLENNGSGTMKIEMRANATDTLPKIKAGFASDNVEIVNATMDDKRNVAVEIKYKDFTKLNTSRQFNNVVFTLTDDAAAQTRTATASIKAANPPIKLSDEQLEYLGKTISISIALPGEVVKTNGEQKDKTVSWSMPLNVMFGKDQMFSATFKSAASASTTPHSATPAADATAASTAKAAGGTDATPAAKKKKK